MFNYKDVIVQLTKNLYPRGRAFKMPEGGYFEALHQGLAESENKAFNDAISILDSQLPDNDNFTADDATDWEVRLGMIVNPTAALDDRKAAIRRKLAFPGNIKARQHRLFIQKQLRDAGFDVYVYENKFDNGSGGYDTKLPNQITGFAHGQYAHGQLPHGGASGGRVVNHIDEVIDSDFVIGSNLKSTFYIGSAAIGTSDNFGVVTGSYPLAQGDAFVDIPESRRAEFRQLILTVKPAQTVCFYFVNFV